MAERECTGHARAGLGHGTGSFSLGTGTLALGLVNLAPRTWIQEMPQGKERQAVSLQAHQGLENTFPVFS